MSKLTTSITEFLSILGDPVRFEIIKLLRNTRKTAKEIEEALEISQSYTSQQLKVLAKWHLIAYEKNDENVRVYSIVNQNIFKVINIIQSFVLEQKKQEYEKLLDENKLETLRI
ncbi:MAG: ArsR family transcriptional regulator [Candidatus Lokiarchaeota archaeon]|nr:ArsR family transcriptional regulator [Candidatus Lokiarchaeota archaeon]MBD3343296.1 ArsR family transcriptional regulator [Candidatus Lokiarchaeota archaeon]